VTLTDSDIDSGDDPDAGNGVDDIVPSLEHALDRSSTTPVMAVARGRPVFSRFMARP